MPLCRWNIFSSILNTFLASIPTHSRLLPWKKFLISYLAVRLKYCQLRTISSGYNVPYTLYCVTKKIKSCSQKNKLSGYKEDILDTLLVSTSLLSSSLPTCYPQGTWDTLLFSSLILRHTLVFLQKTFTHTPTHFLLVWLLLTLQHFSFKRKEDLTQIIYDISLSKAGIRVDIFRISQLFHSKYGTSRLSSE